MTFGWHCLITLLGSNGWQRSDITAMLVLWDRFTMDWVNYNSFLNTHSNFSNPFLPFVVVFSGHNRTGNLLLFSTKYLYFLLNSSKSTSKVFWLLCLKITRYSNDLLYCYKIIRKKRWVYSLLRYTPGLAGKQVII